MITTDRLYRFGVRAAVCGALLSASSNLVTTWATPSRSSWMRSGGVILSCRVKPSVSGVRITPPMPPSARTHSQTPKRPGGGSTGLEQAESKAQPGVGEAIAAGIRQDQLSLAEPQLVLPRLSDHWL